MTTLPSGIYIKGDSLLYRLDARAKVLSFCFFVAAVILTKTVLGYLLLTAILCLMVCTTKAAAVVFAPILRLYPFFLLIFIMNACFLDTGHVLWQFWIFHFSTGGIRQGGEVILRVLYIMAAGNLLSVTTRPLELTGAVSRLLSPLGKIGIPTEEVGMIISVAIQFIPILLEETDTIKKAQTARGASFESRRITERAVSTLPMVIPIFLSAFQRADELSLAMEARGYRGAKHRTKRKYPKLTITDRLAVLAGPSLCLAEVILNSVH